ncbi:hypothetical protein ACFL6I_07875 [candidate division KSB1 bacterium]
MNQKFKNKNTAAVGWLSSFLFHCGLGIIFINIYIDTSIPEREFSEVSFTSIVPSELRAITRESLPAAAPAQQSLSESQQTRLVDLAKRRMLEEEPPRLLEDMRDRIRTQETVQTTGTKIDPVTGLVIESQARPVTRLPGETDLTGTRRIEVGRKVTTEIPTEGIGGNVVSEKPYDIRWEGGDREVLADPLPQFPEGVERNNVVLRMQISVFPDGTMGGIIPLQKGNAILETVTKQALMKWRFNALESSAPQVSQNGVITFRFILK